MVISLILGYIWGVLKVTTCCFVIAACVKYLKTK